MADKKVLGFNPRRAVVNPGVNIFSITHHVARFVSDEAGSTWAVGSCGHAALVTTEERGAMVDPGVEMDCTICSDRKEP